MKVQGCISSSCAVFFHELGEVPEGSVSAFESSASRSRGPSRSSWQSSSKEEEVDAVFFFS